MNIDNSSEIIKSQVFRSVDKMDNAKLATARLDYRNAYEFYADMLIKLEEQLTVESLTILKAAKLAKLQAESNLRDVVASVVKP